MRVVSHSGRKSLVIPHVLEGPDVQIADVVLNSFFFSHLFASASSPQSQGYLREPATPTGWGLFAGCPRATHPTAPLSRQMGRWAPRWAARGASRRAPGALRTRPGSAG